MKQILQLLLLIIPITEILSQEAAINDGPYVFQEDGQRVSRQVINGQPFIKTLSDNSIMNELQVATDTISTWYDGKVINIDARHAKGKSEALLIRKGKYYRSAEVFYLITKVLDVTIREFFIYKENKNVY